MNNYDGKCNNPKLLVQRPNSLIRKMAVILKGAARLTILGWLRTARLAEEVVYRNHSPLVCCKDAQTRLDCSLC